MVLCNNIILDVSAHLLVIGGWLCSCSFLSHHYTSRPPGILMCGWKVQLCISAHFNLSHNCQHFLFIELLHVASVRMIVTQIRHVTVCHESEAQEAAASSVQPTSLVMSWNSPRGVLLLLFGTMPTITVLFNDSYWPGGVQVHIQRGYVTSAHWITTGAVFTVIQKIGTLIICCLIEIIIVVI